LSACDPTLPGYLAKQGFYHGALLLRGQRVDEVLARPGLDPMTDHYLRLAREVLREARQRGFRTGHSYERFIRVERDWVTQIVMAAPKDRLEPYLFKYPVVGGLPYKGFYDEADARQLEQELAAQGYDVYRRPVEAFSTTGWLPDPLLSTMFDSEARLIELLFHELTHAQFYFPNEADFNEAFASWIGNRLAADFVRTSNFKFQKPRADLLVELHEREEREVAFASIVDEIMQEGHRRYARPLSAPQREAYFDWIRARLRRDPRYRSLADRPWNNAFILSLATYSALVRPIDAYAQRERLAPTDLLHRVVERGPGIVHEIVATGAVRAPTGS
jgi:predicted aminopeptidase